MSAVYHLPEPAAANEWEPTSAEWLARDEAALAGVLPRITDVVAVRGQGSWLWDADGRRYLDFGSGIAVTNTGHCHPKVVAAIAEQAATLLHTSVVCHPTGMIRLAERLAALVPFLAEPQVFFCNSGAEAVDGALKLARRATGKPGVICFRRAFHGRTLAATSLTTAKGKYREGYEPLLGSVTVAPYGDLDGLDELLALQAPGANVGAMIVEPVLGEGGYVVPPPGWLAGLRERCDRHGILLIFDEVQTGMGRTGRPFAAETFGVAPDVLLFAKGIASGLPLGGIIAPRAVMDRWPTGAHGSTFGGNPVSCAAALATLDVLEEEGCYERARRLGRLGVERLGAVAGPVDVRGVGLMIGVELRDRTAAEAVQRRCLDDGLIVLLCGPGENVLRLIPPLTIADEEFEEGLRILVAALEPEAAAGGN
ncbi:MAG TPA: aminotransferase class III-fold pyridoxal phosphate-dependent enzyme [Acidimicrobiia bacterium]|nr:aminotransferase class III-fold pyridoxal phosphate-dependent enzyme [Acidimicrobiia bacterium]